MTADSMNERVPYSISDERSVLGCMMLTRDALVTGLGMLTTDDFYVPAHQVVFDAMRHLHQVEHVECCDPGVLASHLASRGDLGAAGGRRDLFVMQSEAPLSLNCAHYARRLQQTGALRRGIDAGNNIVRAAYGGDLDRLADTADKARLAVVTSRTDADDLLYFGDDEHRSVEESRPWLIDGLLRRRERWIITGKEGHGKSTLMRQVAVCVASGLHPFTGLAAGVTAGAQRVLVVDLQEEPDDLDTAIAGLRHRAGAAFNAQYLAGVSRSQGMNLLDPADRAWLESLIARHRPALVCIGPVRKMYRSTAEYTSKMSEEAVDEVTRIIDDLRVAYDCGWLIEAHAGHDRNDSNWRIRGSSVWLDWPEVGMGMKPVGKADARRTMLMMWRDPRHADRRWPSELIAGSGGWPWKLTDADYDALLRALGQDHLLDGGQGDLDLDDEPF